MRSDNATGQAQGSVSGTNSTAMHLQFSYSANGVKHHGEQSVGPLSSLVMNAIPEKFRRLLASKGILQFSDLPSEIQTVLAKKGLNSLEEAPEQFLALGEQYKDPGAVPNELREAVKNEDYEAIARTLDAALPDATPSSLTPTLANQHATPITTASTQWSTIDTSSPLTSAWGQVTVLYNPANPAQYTVRLFNAGDGWLSLLLLVVSTITTLFYAIQIYPRWTRNA